jgi:hypothetical protein
MRLRHFSGVLFRIGHLADGDDRRQCRVFGRLSHRGQRRALTRLRLRLSRRCLWLWRLLWCRRLRRLRLIWHWRKFRHCSLGWTDCVVLVPLHAIGYAIRRPWPPAGSMKAVAQRIDVAAGRIARRERRYGRNVFQRGCMVLMRNALKAAAAALTRSQGGQRQQAHHRYGVLSVHGSPEKAVGS